jgi:hypothetical protein
MSAPLVSESSEGGAAIAYSYRVTGNSEDNLRGFCSNNLPALGDLWSFSSRFGKVRDIPISDVEMAYSM